MERSIVWKSKTKTFCYRIEASVTKQYNENLTGVVKWSCFCNLRILLKMQMPGHHFPEILTGQVWGGTRKNSAFSSILGDPDASHPWKTLWDTAPNLQSLVDSAYRARLALARITAHMKLIPGSTMNPLANNSHSFQARCRKEKSSSEHGIHGTL